MTIICGKVHCNNVRAGIIMRHTISNSTNDFRFRNKLPNQFQSRYKPNQSCSETQKMIEIFRSNLFPFQLFIIRVYMHCSRHATRHNDARSAECGIMAPSAKLRNFGSFSDFCVRISICSGANLTISEPHWSKRMIESTKYLVKKMSRLLFAILEYIHCTHTHTSSHTL